MNLLPKDDQLNLKRERIRRIIVVSGILFSLAVISSIILLLPSYIYLAFEVQSLREQLSFAEKGAEKEKVRKLENELSEFNKKLDILRVSMQSAEKPSILFKEVLAQKPRAVKLDTLLYEKETREAANRISLQGKAILRDDLLVFVKALEDDPMFKRVVSPITNLLQEEDATFSLSLEPKK